MTTRKLMLAMMLSGLTTLAGCLASEEVQKTEKETPKDEGFSNSPALQPKIEQAKPWSDLLVGSWNSEVLTL